ncbi:adhesion G protein-coupled receptor E2 [Lampris incognitus]|uniref:adhesion G protein-coupled receptor E2 n=1 Tax=Lampris incognitus TaxID=2546036 RepID=UPI0024B4BDC2|nr:adhesion G protein-coupled receptor E2 [Lampris incognitus]
MASPVLVVQRQVSLVWSHEICDALFPALHTLLLTELSQPCPLGYTSIGKNCSDYNECVDEDDPDFEHPCGEDAVCENTVGSFYCKCADGFRSSSKASDFTPETSGTCKDINECLENGDICGPNTECLNAIPFYACICNVGFISTTGVETFRGDSVTCRDINECQDNPCGQNAACMNTEGSYHCVCNGGFALRSGKSDFTGDEEKCENKCTIDKTICRNGTCHLGADSHYCTCYQGFTNYGNKEKPCTELNCDAFMSGHNHEQLPGAQDLQLLLEKSCRELSESETPKDVNAEDLLMRLLAMVDELLSGGDLRGNSHVSAVLEIVENALVFIGPIVKKPHVKMSKIHTELELLLEWSTVLPEGPMTLSSEHGQMDIQWETAAGNASSYPGFATISLLTWKNLENYTDGFFSGMKDEGVKSYRINSKVLTASISNRDRDFLKEPVTLTFHHLTESVLQLNHSNHTCVYWDSAESGTWSAHGCSVVESNSSHTVCSCTHLSSFAVLMALYDFEHPFELQLITWMGLSLSLLCLILCILTFALIHSIQSTRNTIHLHLCISLFLANLVFLAGISRTENRAGCAVVAGLLHFFYLAAFCWMCLEGIQLFRMVVLVFNTTFKTTYMMAGGYGIPAVIVAISAIADNKGYGTSRHCWLNVETEFIWGFLGPACVIIIVNIIFFSITVWKLAQKFSSLNPDLNNLRKIKAFTVTAVAQLCVLGSMWIFGCFQFGAGTIAMSYLFTILNSVQGALLFIMHCLLSKQVREEYEKLLSRVWTPQKKSYSEFSSSQLSKVQVSKGIESSATGLGIYP